MSDDCLLPTVHMHRLAAAAIRDVREIGRAVIRCVVMMITILVLLVADDVTRYVPLTFA